MRDIITLAEDRLHRVWLATDRDTAKTLMEHIEPTMRGNYGYGLYCHGEPPERLDGVVLEFILRDDHRILDLRDAADRKVWQDGHYMEKRDSRHLWKLLARDGIDGVCDDSGYCVFNPKALEFSRVFAGVVDDPLEETDTAELDEFALGGLKRCTAVTVNALLRDQHKPGITLSEVPINHPGVLHILAAKGLAYRPHPEDTGRSVQQFVTMHRTGDWYLLSQGHAMALVKGQLFDAENKGADAVRKLIAAFEITRR